MRSALRASLVLAVCLAPAPLAAAEPQRLLGPGDLVPGFGRIGGWGFSAHGLDDAGRVLLLRDGDARQALWAGDDGLTHVLPPDVALPFVLPLYRADASGVQRLIRPASRPTTNTWPDCATRRERRNRPPSP